MLERNHLPLRPAAPLFAVAWVAVIAGASVALSLLFACVTPFVALAAVSAVVLPRRMALMAVLLAWFANQTVGYLVLGYPQTFDSYAWGTGDRDCSICLACGGARGAAPDGRPCRHDGRRLHRRVRCLRGRAFCRNGGASVRRRGVFGSCCRRGSVDQFSGRDRTHLPACRRGG